MRAAHRIAGNTGVIVIGRMLGLGISLATVFLLTANLTKADFGTYNFVFVYIGIFSVVTEMGMSPVLVREMARHRDRAGDILGTGILLKCAFAVISFLLALLLLPAIREGEILLRLVFILGFQLFAYPILTCMNIFKIELKMIYPVSLDLARNAIYLGAVWYVVQTPRLGLEHLLALAVVSSFAVAATMYWLSLRYVKIRLVFLPDLARRLVRASIPLGLSQLAIICYYRVDTMMLMRMKGEEAVGYYSLAVKISEVFSYLPSAFMVSVYPFLSRFWHESREKFLEATELSLRSLLALALPIGIIGCLFARQILSVVPGGYAASAGSLVYLIWAEVFIFLNVVLYNVMNAMNQERWNLWTTLIMLTGNIALNLHLIPRYSHPGASLATLTTEAIGFLILGTTMLILVGFQLDLGRMLRTAAAGGALAGGLALFVRGRAIGLPEAILLAALGALLYTGLLYLLRVIDIQELKRLLLDRPQDSERQP